MKTMLLALALIIAASSCSDSDFSGQSSKNETPKKKPPVTEPEVVAEEDFEATTIVEEDEPTEFEDEEPEPKPKKKRKDPPEEVEATPAVDLIQNGSFETHSVPGVVSEYFAGDSTSLANWRITGGSVHVCDPSVFQPVAGKYSVDLDGNTGSKGGIAQVVATASGKKYRLVFRVGANTYAGPTVKSLRVEVNTQTRDVTFDGTGKAPQAMAYAEQEWVFVADSATTEVRFISTTSGLPGWGAVIDQVQMFEVKK